MEAHLTMMNCKTSHAACRARLDKRTKPSLAARLTTLAVALAALLVMSYGERWVLEETPAAANELTAATCALDSIYAGTDAGAATVCTSGILDNDKEKAL